MAKPAETNIVTCPSCGARNRLRRVGAAGKEPVCGRCHRQLPTSPVKPVTVTDMNFNDIVAASPVPVLLDLWAAWCGPCRLIAPTIEQLAAELDGRVLIGKLDVDANPQTSARFGVQSIPTLLILKEGREVDRLIGVQPKSSILRHLQRFF